MPKPRLIYVRPALKKKKIEGLSDSFYENLDCSANFSGSPVQPQISPSLSISLLFSSNFYSSTGTTDNTDTLISAEPTSIQAHSALHLFRFDRSRQGVRHNEIRPCVNARFGEGSSSLSFQRLTGVLVIN